MSMTRGASLVCVYKYPCSWREGELGHGEEVDRWVVYWLVDILMER